MSSSTCACVRRVIGSMTGGGSFLMGLACYDLLWILTGLRTLVSVDISANDMDEVLGGIFFAAN